MGTNRDIRTLLLQYMADDISADDRVVLYQMLLDDRNEQRSIDRLRSDIAAHRHCSYLHDCES